MVAALPRIIASFRARGYRFVTISGLIGKHRDDLMPPLPSPTAKAALQASELPPDIGQQPHQYLLPLVVRSRRRRRLCPHHPAVVVALALVQRRRKRRRVPVSGVGNPLVSVIVPAYNEALSAVAVVSHILRSNYQNL